MFVTASETILLSKVRTNEGPFISVSHLISSVSNPSSPVIQDLLFIFVVYPDMKANAIHNAFSAPNSSIMAWAALANWGNTDGCTCFKPLKTSSAADAIISYG